MRAGGARRDRRDRRALGVWAGLLLVHPFDWFVVGAYLVWIVWDGLRRSTAPTNSKATSSPTFIALVGSRPVGDGDAMSAITLVGGTGQGYADGMRFVQFYFGLPIAMVILSLTLVPFFHRARVYTAHEHLEQRFDVKTRTLASLLFLLQRGMSCGVIIAAPAVILSIVLGWNLTLTILAIGAPTVLYTLHGGVQAVTWTDVKQMAVIVAGVLAAVVALIAGLPDDVSFVKALHVAGAAAGSMPWISASTGTRPTRSGQDCSAGCSGCCRIQLRSEPGAAVSDREVHRPGALVADDERLLEDPAAGADTAHGRARVRLLPCSTSRRCSSTACTRRRWTRAAAPRDSGHSSRSSGRPSRCDGRQRVRSPPRAPMTPLRRRGPHSVTRTRR